MVLIGRLLTTGQTHALKAELEKDQAQTNKECDRLTKQSEEMRQSFEDAEKGFRRANLLLLARLSDYAKELTFWRDTLRKAIYQSTKDRNSAEALIRTVTKGLRTYSTLGKNSGIADFENLKLLARYIDVHDMNPN